MKIINISKSEADPGFSVGGGTNPPLDPPLKKLLTLKGKANPITNTSPKLRLAIKILVTLSRSIKLEIVMRIRMLPETQISMKSICASEKRLNIAYCSNQPKGEKMCSDAI